MLQKEREKGAEETVQQMQLVHVAVTVFPARRGDLQFKELLQTRGQPACRQGCTDHPQPCVHPSVFALHVWLQARPGMLRAGGLGLQIEMPYAWWGWKGYRPRGTASLYIHLHA